MDIFDDMKYIEISVILNLTNKFLLFISFRWIFPSQINSQTFPKLQGLQFCFEFKVVLQRDWLPTKATDSITIYL